MSSTTSRSLSVLVVDDDPGDVALITEALEQIGTGQTVQVARDGQEAVDLLRGNGPIAAGPAPDVVLLDLKMPRKNGQQVLTEMKSDPQLCQIPVIVLAASQDPVDIARSYELHANAYVIKPVGLDDWRDVLARIRDFYGRVASLPTK